MLSLHRVNSQIVAAIRLPLIDGGRYWYGLDLPDEVFQHSSIQQLGEIAKDMVFM